MGTESASTVLPRGLSPGLSPFPFCSPSDSPAICFMNVMQTPSAPRTPPFTSSRTNHTNYRREAER